jgi:hypothetical protein
MLKQSGYLVGCRISNHPMSRPRHQFHSREPISQYPLLFDSVVQHVSRRTDFQLDCALGNAFSRTLLIHPLRSRRGLRLPGAPADPGVQHYRTGSYPESRRQTGVFAGGRRPGRGQLQSWLDMGPFVKAKSGLCPKSEKRRIARRARTPILPPAVKSAAWWPQRAYSAVVAPPHVEIRS